MTDPLLDLYQTRPTIWQQNQLNMQTSPVVTGSAVSTPVGTATTVDPTQDPLLVEDNPYDDYADNTSRVVLGINYQPPKWKEGETVHNYGSKVDSTRVFQDGSRFNIALKEAGYTPEMWLRTPYAIKRDILKKYAEQDFARLKPELQQAERSADKYFEKIAKAYGVGANDEYDDSALSVIADAGTEALGGAVRGVNSLISLADEAQNRMGVDLHLGVQKALGATTKALQETAGGEEVEGNSEYFNYLVDNDRVGEALEMAAKHPALLTKLLGPELAAMAVGTKGLGMVGGAVGKGVEAGANLSTRGAKVWNYLKNAAEKGFTGSTVTGKAAATAGNLALKGAQYRTVSALQEAGGFRLEQYLNNRDVTTEDAKHAFELAFLEQYVMQGLLPGTVDNIAYNILNRSGKYAGAAGKTINELKDFVKNADEGSILKRLNHKVDQIGGIGAVKRLATTAGKEYVDEFAANSFQELLGQNLSRIQDPLIPEEQRAKAGSLSFSSTLGEGDLDKARKEGNRGGIIGLFMGAGAHPLGDAGHNVQAYKQAKADIADIDAQLAGLDVSSYNPVNSDRTTNDIQARADEIAQEFAQGDRTNEDEFKHLIQEQQGKVTSLMDTVSRGHVSVEDANKILRAVNERTDLVNKMTETLGKQQNVQNGTNPAAMQGQFNDFASKFESARKAANFNDNDEYVQGIADEIRALRDPANIPAAEARLSEMKQSPMMGDAKFADMVGAYESAVNFAKDPQAYFQSVPAKDPDAKAKITSFTKDARAVVKEFDKDGIIPPALKDTLAKRGVTADELNTSVTGAINQLLQFANQAQQDGAPERAGRYAAAANRLLTAKLALVDLGQYADARNQNYEDAQKQSIIGERTAAENEASEIAQNEASEQAEEIKKQQAAFERQLVVDTKAKVRKVLETAHSGFIADPNAKGVSNNLGETRAEVEANLEKLIADTYQLAQKTPDLVAASALYKRSRDLQEVLNISRGLGGMQTDPGSQAGALLNQLYPDANVANRVANNVDMLAKMAHVKVSVRGKNTVLTPAVDAIITALNGGALVNSKRVSKDIDLNLVRDEAVAYLEDVKAGRADDITAEQHPNLFKYVGDELIGTTKTSEKGKVAQEMTDETRETKAKQNAETREQERKHDKAFDELLTEVHNETMARTADEEMVKTKSKKSPKSSSELSRAILDPANKEHVDTIFRNPTTFKRALQDYGVMEALKFAKRGFAENDPRGKVVDKLVELVDDSVLIRYDNLAVEGRTGYYDIASNMIVLDINSKEPDIDLIHELVHAYTVYALENRAALDEEQRVVIDELIRAWENALRHPEFVAQFPTIADEVTGVHEFVAEMLSNPKFQTAYDKLHANGAPRGFFDSVRAFFKRIGALLGLNSNEQPALFQLITNTTSLFEANNGRTQTIKGVPGLSRKIVRQVIFAGRTQEQNRDSHIAAIAQLDEDTGLWSLNWWDEQGQSHEETGLTWDQTETLAQKSGFVPKHRSEMSQQEKYVQDVTEMAYNHSGLLYNLFKGIQRVLPPQFSEPVLRVLDRTIRWSAINLNNSTSWITTLENIARNAYGAKVPVEVETRINALRQKASAELNHYGVGGKLNLRDHMDILTQLAQRSGMTKEDLDDLAYALRAPHFIRRKKRASGEQDPYYKGRDLLTDTITGFGYYVLNGKRVAKGTKGATWVKDDTGEKYMASLTPQQRAFAKEFEKAIIEMNNNTLDFELAMGRIDENTYNDLYGEFYVPLQNEDSEVKAFSGRIHGRSTKAGNILSKYVANSQARINNAAESAIMREAADLLAKYPMPHMARIMSDELKTRGDKFHATYAPEGILDGRSKAFYRNGKRERIVLTDEIAAQSLAKMSKAQKNNVTNTFIRHLGATTRWLGLTRTVLNPTFHITAFIRDMTLVLANTQAASRGKLSDAESLQLSGRIIPRMVRVLPMLLKGQWNGKNAHFTYKTYLNEGGINPMAHYDLDKITDDLDMLAFNRGSVGSRTARGAKTLMQVMHFSDNAARFSAWLEYLQMQNGGREFNSEHDLIEFLRNHPEIANTARDISKNLTGNFEQKGAWGTPRSFWMFWNAIMGGVKTTYNLVNPKYGTYGLLGCRHLLMLC
jgi:phosphoribosylformylglycinamidine (FGAM) synthase PurS component